MNESKEARELVERIANKSLAQRIREKRELVRVGKEAYSRVQSTRRSLFASLIGQIKREISWQKTLQAVCREFPRYQDEMNALLDVAKCAQEERCTIAEAEEKMNARQSARVEMTESLDSILAWARSVGGPEEMIRKIEQGQREEKQRQEQMQRARLRAAAGLGCSTKLVEQLSFIASMLETYNESWERVQDEN